MHFEKMIVQINNNAVEVNFSTYESPNTDPKTYDVRKTPSHELFHAMGIDHNSSNDSIVFYMHVFGPNNGYAANETDEDDLESRYP